MKNGGLIRRLLIALLSLALVFQCLVIFGSEKRSFLTFAEEPSDPERFTDQAFQPAADAPASELPPSADPVEETAPEEKAAGDDGEASSDIVDPEGSEKDTSEKETGPKADGTPRPESVNTPVFQPEAAETSSPEVPDAFESDQPAVPGGPLTVAIGANREYAFLGRDTVVCSVEVGMPDVPRRLRLVASTAAGEKPVEERILGNGERFASFEYIPDIPGDQTLIAFAETVNAEDGGAVQTASASVPLTVPEYGRENDWVWREKLKALDLNGDWRHDLLTVAESQLGERESKTNYILVDGQKKGSTRYGVWVDDEYGDWCGAFVSFCIANAKIPEAGLPRAAGCSQMLSVVRKAGALEEPDYIPSPGDLVFLRKKGSLSAADHIGIVKSRTGGSLVTVEGNTSDNDVGVVSRDLNNADAPSSVVGYANLSKLEEKYSASQEDEKRKESEASDGGDRPEKPSGENEPGAALDGETKCDNDTLLEEIVEDVMLDDEDATEEVVEDVMLDDQDTDKKEPDEEEREKQEEQTEQEELQTEQEEQIEQTEQTEQTEQEEQTVQESQPVQRILVSEQEGMPRVEVSGLLPENVTLKVTVLPNTVTGGQVGSAYNILSALDITIVDENGAEYRFASPLTVQVDLGETGVSGGPLCVWQAAEEAAGTEKAVRMTSEDRGNGRIVFTIQPTAAPQDINEGSRMTEGQSGIAAPGQQASPAPAEEPASTVDPEEAGGPAASVSPVL